MPGQTQPSARATSYCTYDLHGHAGVLVLVTRHRLVAMKCALGDSPIPFLRARGYGNLTGASSDLCGRQHDIGRT